jgi:hypothetical protein
VDAIDLLLFTSSSTSLLGCYWLRLHTTSTRRSGSPRLWCSSYTPWSQCSRQWSCPSVRSSCRSGRSARSHQCRTRCLRRRSRSMAMTCTTRASSRVWSSSLAAKVLVRGVGRSSSTIVAAVGCWSTARWANLFLPSGGSESQD